MVVTVWGRAHATPSLSATRASVRWPATCPDRVHHNPPRHRVPGDVSATAPVTLCVAAHDTARQRCLAGPDALRDRDRLEFIKSARTSSGQQPQRWRQARRGPPDVRRGSLHPRETSTHLATGAPHHADHVALRGLAPVAVARFPAPYQGSCPIWGRGQGRCARTHRTRSIGRGHAERDPVRPDRRSSAGRAAS